MFCCHNVLDLGCKAFCDCLVLSELWAEQSGDHILYYQYSGSLRLHQFILRGMLVGQPFYFPVALNPYQVVTFWVQQPDETFLVFPPTDCFRFRTLPTLPADRFTSCAQRFMEVVDCIFEVFIDSAYSTVNSRRLVIYTDCDIVPDFYIINYTLGRVRMDEGFIDLYFPSSGAYTLEIIPQRDHYQYIPFLYTLSI